MKGWIRIYISFCLLCLLLSCKSTKYVPEGQYLLDKVEIATTNKEVKSLDLKAYLRQQPNFKMFGLVKTQLYVYNWSGKDSTRWMSRQLRKVGEAPVILDTALVSQSANELQRFLVNKGYMFADVTTKVDTSGKKATVIYDVIPNAPYRIGTYLMDIEDKRIDSIARLTPPRKSRLASVFHNTSPDLYQSFVKEGNLFDRDMLDKERQRITSLLRRRGYYAFNRDYIAYLADSSFNENIVNLDLRVKPFLAALPDGGTAELPHRTYTINNVVIVTDYDPLKSDINAPHFLPTDTLKLNNYYIVYGENGRTIRPNVLRKSCFITPGTLYNERSVEQTYSAFSGLNALRNINIRFTEKQVNDSLTLDCLILTSPAKPQSFGVDLEGTNTAGNLGFASSFNYQHRNIFRGSEVFGIKLRGAYEGISGFFGQNFFELGAETSLSFPSFLFPFISKDFKRKIRATTELKVSYNYQKRPEYDRTVLSGGWNYIWQGRANNTERHVVKLLDIDYVYVPHIDSTFKQELPQATELYNYSSQFIAGTGYTYSFSNFNPQNKQKNTTSIRVSAELAGNLLYAISRLTHAQKDTVGNYSLFGINYSQFAKVDFDFSKTIVLDNRNTLAYHVGFGIALPYGNASMVPFERRYFAGGANGVRGWSVRGLGPGGMPITDSTNIVHQAGDIRLDLNIEYRTQLFWKFQLAAYIDAGNIWTIRNYKDQPDGEFRFNQFYKQIAVSYGLGLRLDFDFFLIRFDTGMKAFNPQERGKDRWAILKPNLKNNFAWHFAVGYPF